MTVTATQLSAKDERPAALPPFAAGSVAAVAAALATLLTVLSGRHGFHRDELYFMAAGDRLDWGYTDQPPLTPLLARLSTAIFGETPSGLRVITTLAVTLSVVLLALIARELGGGRGAQVIAAASGAASGVTMAVGHMLLTVTFDLFISLLISWLVLRLLRTGDGRWYLAIGLAAGIGLQNKRLVAMLLAGLLVAVLAIGPRRVLRSWWLVAGIAAAFVIALPNLVWEVAHGFPQLTVAATLSDDDGSTNRLMFVVLQVVQLSPLLVPVWVAGFVWLWRDQRVRWARSFVVAYVLLAVAVIAAGGSSHYVLPVLMVVMAAGAVPVARWAQGPRRTAVLAAGLALAAASSAVITLPLLPASSTRHIAGLNAQQGEQLGWPDMVETVAGVWQQIPAQQRDRSVLLVFNYGETGAIARYGPEHGLPAPYSGHMSFADWGPPPDSADGPVLLVVPAPNRWVTPNFKDCRTVASIDNGYGLDNELWEHVVKLCSGPVRPWSQLWPSLRHY